MTQALRDEKAKLLAKMQEVDGQIDMLVSTIDTNKTSRQDILDQITQYDAMVKVRQETERGREWRQKATAALSAISFQNRDLYAEMKGLRMDLRCIAQSIKALNTKINMMEGAETKRLVSSKRHEERMERIKASNSKERNNLSAILRWIRESHANLYQDAITVLRTAEAKFEEAANA